MELDTNLPSWLQRNLAPRESFDPSPWLNEAFNQNVQRAKLPLQLQQYELANKQSQLAIEHQGIVNDVANQELNAYAEDLPKLRSYLENVSKSPNSALDVQPPMLRSQRAIQAVLQHQKMAADTALGATFMQDQIALTKEAAKVLALGIDPTPAMENGKWNRSALSDLALKATEDENMREIALRKAGTEWHNNLATGGNADIVLVEFDGNKFLKNTKTGALHPLEKHESKKNFIAKHISSWMKDNLWTADEAAKNLGEFYDKNLGSTETPTAPAAKSISIRVQKPDGTVGVIPATRLDEAIKAGWKKLE